MLRMFFCRSDARVAFRDTNNWILRTEQELLLPLDKHLLCCVRTEQLKSSCEMVLWDGVNYDGLSVSENPGVFLSFIRKMEESI